MDKRPPAQWTGGLFIQEKDEPCKHGQIAGHLRLKLNFKNLSLLTILTI